MADFQTYKDVTTRKPHRCFGCNREFPAGTRMEYRSWIDDRWAHGYFCRTCLEVEGELRKEGFLEYCRGDLREDALEYENGGQDDV